MLRGIAACADLGARADTLLADLRAGRAVTFAFAFAIGDSGTPSLKARVPQIRYSLTLFLTLFHRVEHSPYFHH